MKLRNKKTGECCNFTMTPIEVYSSVPYRKYHYYSVAELNEEWEDYEDEHLYVISAENSFGYECVLKDDYATLCDTAVELGIGFESEKEAEKTVERLKAWKRLKDKGFKWGLVGGSDIDFSYPDECCNDKSFWSDIDLLFGGEE